jgi:hypothetical protein
MQKKGGRRWWQASKNICITNIFHSFDQIVRDTTQPILSSCKFSTKKVSSTKQAIYSSTGIYRKNNA